MSTDLQSARTIFLDALEQSDSTQRDQFIEAACNGDPELRGEVKRLLDAHGDLDNFMGHPAAASVNPTLDLPATEQVGATIGRYKLLEQIGEGGMGVVYVAEQTEPVRRRVALKIIKPGMDTRQVIARFEAERQALAMMDHPNIAKVLDGGTTDDSVGQAMPDYLTNRQTSQAQADLRSGRPYFVMELVRGMPITDYCDQAKFDVRGRLDLFTTVCQAVQHAHQKGVIHRDIKPSNVLVTMHDGQPVVKVIDFGVAKAVNQHLTERTIYTAFTEIIGTPLYMSPEQAELSGLDIDTRSDVYSLGVLLYELLTGQTPFDRDTLVPAGLDEIRRMIREDEPPRPSHRISTLKADAGSTVGQRRGIDQRQLSRALHGELDWIVMKSLEKDRNRRYESASAFAADIERYLNHEPVQAGPPSALYRFRKFARRRRAALVAIALVAASLLAGVGVSVWQAAEAHTARNRAEANYATASQAVDDMYVQVAERWLADEPHMEPLQREFLLKALAFFERYVEQEGETPAAQLQVARAQRRCGEVHFRLGEFPQAKQAFQHAIHRLKKYDGLRSNIEARVELAKSHHGLGEVLGEMAYPVSSDAGIEANRRAAVRLWRELVLERPANTQFYAGLVAACTLLGRQYMYSGNHRAADDAFAEGQELAQQLIERSANDAHSHYLSGCLDREFGELRNSQRRYEEASDLFEQSAASLSKSLQMKPRNPAARNVLCNARRWHGIAQFGLNRKDQAHEALMAAIDDRQRLVKEFPRVPLFQKELGVDFSLLADRCAASGDSEIEPRRLAVQHLKAAYEANASDIYTCNFLANEYRALIFALEADGENPESQAVRRQYLAHKNQDIKLRQDEFDSCASRFGKEHRDTLVALSRLASAHWAVENYDSAVELVEQPIKSFEQLVDRHGLDEELLPIFAQLYVRKAYRLSERKSTRPAADEARRKAREISDAVGSVGSHVLYPLGVLQYRAGEYADSLKSFERNLVAIGKPGSAWDFFYLAMNHAKLGHNEQAQIWFKKAEAWMEEVKPKTSAQDTGWMRHHVPRHADLGALLREATALIQATEHRPASD
jgi:serine/threonine protein kinase